MFARLLNPHHEVFGGRMVLATALSLIGALVLSLDVEHVLALVALPPSLAAIARWHWPRGREPRVTAKALLWPRASTKCQGDRVDWE